MQSYSNMFAVSMIMSE